MSVLEAGMIVCFGISWPVAILKTLKTRRVDGKSRTFLFLVLAGYGFGVLHKILFSLDLVLLLYVFNFSMVLVEICLWFKYRERPRALAVVVPAITTGVAPRPHATDTAPAVGVELPAFTCRRR